MSDLLTVRDVATISPVREVVVVRRAKLDGVMDLGKSALGPAPLSWSGESPRLSLRSILAGKSGRSVTLTVPERAERRRKSPKWEDRRFAISQKQACKTRPLSHFDAAKPPFVLGEFALGARGCKSGQQRSPKTCRAIELVNRSDTGRQQLKPGRARRHAEAHYQ